MYENIIAYWEESEWNEALVNKCGSSKKQLGGDWGGGGVGRVMVVTAMQPQENIEIFTIM